MKNNNYPMIGQKWKQMSKHPRFKDLIPLFETNSDFSITKDQYEKMTGAPLPKGTYYLLNGSALYKKATEHGFELVLNERTVSFKKRN